jgi:hypothetical protein
MQILRIRREKALFLAQNRLKTGQNRPVLSTDKLMVEVSILLINRYLQARGGGEWGF